jgi:16S rRNA (uracil1498-N3)-methyltransferase
MKENRETAERRLPRVLVAGVPLVAGLVVPLSKEERLHVRSRRLKDGDTVVVLNGKGVRARGAIAEKGSAVLLLPLEESPSPGSPGSPVGEPHVRVTVALACAEPARVEWAIEKGTECGAAGFVLLAAERSQKSHVVALKARLPRLRRIAEEATKQCDRSVVPGIEGPESTGDFLRRVRGAESASFLVADPGGVLLGVAGMPRSPLLLAQTRFAQTVRSGVGGTSAPRPPDVLLAIGPEGGFSPREISLFEENGALLVSLGPRILRLETAVVAALTLLVDPA